jgi:hypothetical protein
MLGGATSITTTGPPTRFASADYSVENAASGWMSGAWMSSHARVRPAPLVATTEARCLTRQMHDQASGRLGIADRPQGRLTRDARQTEVPER